MYKAAVSNRVFDTWKLVPIEIHRYIKAIYGDGCLMWKISASGFNVPNIGSSILVSTYDINQCRVDAMIYENRQIK